jgi:hypothetical protein
MTELISESKCRRLLTNLQANRRRKRVIRRRVFLTIHRSAQSRQKRTAITAILRPRGLLTRPVIEKLKRVIFPYAFTVLVNVKVSSSATRKIGGPPEEIFTA